MSTPPSLPEKSLPVLSRVQAATLLEARALGAERAALSFDLGLSSEDVELQDAGVSCGLGLLAWELVHWLTEQENVCFEWENGELTPIRSFSESLGRTYQLMPTQSSPGLLLAGFTMHRFRDVSPVEGAQAMVQAVLPLRGALLDTATGLGYAAIEAARHASSVLSIELDAEVQRIAARNPWSRGLFVNPKIARRIGDSATLIRELPDAAFAAVVHDPPAINLAGELYSEAFYGQVLRVLTRGGRVFHYVGDPQSDSGGRVTKGVVRRLLSAGFSQVKPVPAAFGVLARK